MSLFVSHRSCIENELRHNLFMKALSSWQDTLSVPMDTSHSL